MSDNEAVKEMRFRCASILQKGREIEIKYPDGEKIIELYNEYKEVFPGVFMKVIFPQKKGSTFVIKAKAGSSIDLYKTLPMHFIFVAKGEHRTAEGMVYRKGDDYYVKPNQSHAIKFKEDSELIIESE